MSDFKYIVPPNEPKIIRSPGEVGIAPTISENISNSCIFNGTDQYLYRTFSTPTNQYIYTISFWMKRGDLSRNQRFFEGFTSASDAGTGIIEFTGTDKLNVGGYSTNHRITTQVFRDISSWYHIVVTWDTTQTIANDRIKVYVNGTQITAFDTLNNPSQNVTFGFNNNSTVHQIGRRRLVSGNDLYYNGYLSEIYFIDGQALTPSSFGQYSNRTNSWVPKRYTGTYGTNGLRLSFNNSAALGTDSSGNTNTWTLNNITSSNQTTDSPTNNFCTLNPLRFYSTTAPTLSNGNLTAAWNNTAMQVGSSIAIPNAQKIYAEFTLNTIGSARIGIKQSSDFGQWTGGWTYVTNLGKIRNTADTDVQTVSAASSGNIVGVAVDLVNNTVQFYLNNSALGTSNSISNSNDWIFWIGQNTTATAQDITANFGQRSFTYTPPAGFKSLCSANLDIPIIRKPNQFFDAKTYTGTGSTQSITGFNFAPDFVWTKGRNLAQNHNLFDTLRIGSRLRSDSTNAEASSTVTIDSNGFTLGTETENNNASSNFISWLWCAGSSTATNTSGSITSSVRVNPISKFSIVSYTGNGTAGATVGHGLGVAPKFVIIKNRQTNGYDFVVYHQNMDTSPQNGYVSLNATIAFTTLSTIWNNTAPSSSVITFGTNAALNESAKTHIAYCFAEVDGYSKFGSYTGNASSDGPFVYCGFRPRWVIIKRVNLGSRPWCIHDTARDIYNVSNSEIEANAATIENGGSYPGDLDILSNGFKPREGSTAWINESGGNYIFAAFAEMPFKYANAR